MAELRRDYQKFVLLNAEIIAIGPEQYDNFREFWEKEKMPFTGLSDHDQKVANLYGQEVNLLKLGRMPALFIIDKNSIILYVHKGKAMWDIPKNKVILEILKNIGD